MASRKKRQRLAVRTDKITDYHEGADSFDVPVDTGILLIKGKDGGTIAAYASEQWRMVRWVPMDIDLPSPPKGPQFPLTPDDDEED